MLVSSVVEDSPADQAGMKAGDLLLRLGGTAIDVRFDEQMPDFMLLATSLPIGKEVDAVVKRDGKEITLRLEPAERGELYPKQHELKQWGMTVRDFSYLLAKEMKRTNLDGVLVTSVRPGGPAGECKPSFEARDILVEVNGTPVKNVSRFDRTDPQVDRRQERARSGHRRVRAQGGSLPCRGQGRHRGIERPGPGSHQGLVAR